jgi:hypothetical protein
MSESSVVISQKKCPEHFNEALFLEKVVGKREDILDVLSIVDDCFNNCLDELSEAIDIKSLDRVKKVAHKMNGTSSTACFDNLTQISKRIEGDTIYDKEIAQPFYS